MPGLLGNGSTSPDTRRSVHDELAVVRAVLIAEFAGRVTAGTVTRQLALARERLLADGVRAGLAPAAEAMTRIWLASLTPSHLAGP